MNAVVRHAEIKRCFHEALELQAERREAWLATLPDRALADEVRTLLAAHLAADTEFLATGAGSGGAGGAIDPATLGLERGWRVLRELARGGMGVVYLAERADGAYQQQVALKLLRPDAWATPESLLRLKLERQILARLQHPNIARLLDGGTTASGTPYLVMEYIDGERIDHWCDGRQADVSLRVRLVLKVCAAVAYAHRHLIVHRDIKPGNILVDAAGEPHLLDFGIAREVANDSSLTRAGERLLTPRYASPEQMREQPATTQSDLYSLGVLLYELLTGASPYAVEGDSVLQLMEAVCQQPPLLPSRRAAAQAQPPVPPARLRGDLDAILLKCLAKRPQERYASVEALAEDLQAVLSGGVVAARRGHRWYALRSFLRRHWIGLAVAASVLGLSLAFVLRLDQQLRATEQARAQQARTIAFITDLFRIADPGEARGSQVTVREVLDRGAGLLASDPALDPAVRADLLATLGLVYRQLGLLEASAKILGEALRAATQLDAAARSRLQLELAATAIEQAHWEVAAQALATASADLGEAGRDHPRLQFLQGYLALRQGQFAQAEPHLEHALALLKKLVPSPARQVAETLLALGNVARDRADIVLAEARVREALALLESAGGDPWALARVHSNLAVLAGDRGDFAGAEQAAQRAHALIEAAVGPQHPAASTALLNLASMKSRLGRHEEAAGLFRQVLEARRASLGPQHPQTASTEANLAYIEFAQGRYAQARTLLQDALAVLERELAPGHLLTASAWRNLVAVEFAEGQLAAALAANARLLSATAAIGEGHPLLLQARVRAAALACIDGACDGAELQAAVAAHERKLGAAHAEVGESLAWLAALEAIGALGAACPDGGAASRYQDAGRDVAAWDRALWQWAAARCGGGDPRVSLEALRARYGGGHPLLLRIEGRRARAPLARRYSVFAGT